MLEEKLKAVKPRKMENIDVPTGEIYPTVCLNDKALPEIKDWEVGEEYYLVLKVEQTRKDMNSDDGGENWHADFNIKEIGVLDDMEDEMMDDEEDTEMDKQSLKKKYLS